MLLLLEAMNFYIYAEFHWKYHTFEGYYTCSFSKLRHKAHQKVCKCSLTFPLMNGIVTFYVNCTNKYVRVDTLRGWYSTPWVPCLYKVYLCNVMGYHNNLYI